MDKIEKRSYVTQFTADNDSRNVHGLAIPVEAKSELLGGEFYEVIRSTAVTQELIDQNDIKLYINHDSSQGTYARSKYGKGTLHLYVTDAGLEFDFDCPKSAFGDALLEGIVRGDYDAVSFAFVVGQDKWDMDEDGRYLRSILSFDAIDEISCLSCAPAYSTTELDIRSLNDYKDKCNKEAQIVTRLDNIMQEVNDSCDKYTI